MGYESRVYVCDTEDGTEDALVRAVHRFYKTPSIYDIFKKNGVTFEKRMHNFGSENPITDDSYGEKMTMIKAKDFLPMIDDKIRINGKDPVLKAIKKVVEAEIELWNAFGHNDDGLVLVHYGE